MSNRISQQQLEAYLWGAAVLLRGTIDAGDYKQFIFPLLFYKRLCDVFDEETAVALAESGGDLDFAAYPENHRFQIPRDAHWMSTRQTTGNVGIAIQSAMRAIEKANPETLYGIFGDAQWTNKDRLPDAMLRDLVEHFSTLDLTIANLPEDELGQGYEYLIKKFADDSGHTAAEFYTNRTVVHLMTEMLEPRPGESVYDPTCGSGGMLLSCIAHLRRRGQEWRNVRLYGQERNLMTSSIARMNCFLHGIEEFQIVRGDTLSDPKFVEGDHLRRFDLVLANPPYSIKQWDREAFASDSWGRNLYGTPPQGRADYAFWQHIICSLSPKTGRCAILFPHGVLFRDAEAEMRRKLIEADLIECVVGLGMNLFYNSSMPSCVVICRTNKPRHRRGKILLINAVAQVTRERAQSFLTEDHIERIVSAYTDFNNRPGFARVVNQEDVRAQDGNLNLSLYVSGIAPDGNSSAERQGSVKAVVAEWLDSRNAAAECVKQVLPKIGLATSTRTSVSSAGWRLFDEKSKWQRVHIAEAAFKTEDTERNPLNVGLRRYLMVEHLDADCVRIKRWGDLADGNVPPTFYKIFRKGQVLYPTRNPHLRRAAFADFDGICGEKTLTLSPCQGVVAEFLPFVFQSEAFIRFATERRIGSTNPHVRWRDVAEFEFGLPSLAQQRRIANILWALDDVQEKLEVAVASAGEVLAAELDHFLYRGPKWPLLECRDLLSEGPRNGYSPPVSDNGGGVPTLSISAIRGGTVMTEGNLKYAGVAPEEVTQFTLRSGDILVVRGNGNRLLCGRAGIVRSFPEGCFYPDLLIRLRFNSATLLPEFAVMHWNEPTTHLRLLRKAKSTNGISKINGQDILSHRLCVPPVVTQRRFLEGLRAEIATRDGLIRSAKACEALRRALVKGVFE